MGKTDKPAWAKHILELLKQAAKKDEDFLTFGADSHRYKLSAPVSAEKIQTFERQYGISLPEEYRNFLMQAGNGGAGPYYGLYGLRELDGKLSDTRMSYFVQKEPVIYPKMSDEDWDRAVGSEDSYTGILPIGSQGCTLMTGLVLKGPYQGQVVYYDEDFCGKPFFVREKGFLAWYERWLREVIAGYNDEGVGFGIYVDGDPGQLMELYQQTENLEEKFEIIESYNKFETLPDEQQIYFMQACEQETDMKIRAELIKMMSHFDVKGLAEEIEKLWEYGAYEEAISVLTCEEGWQRSEKWCERILDKLPKLHGQAFSDACYATKWMAAHPRVCAGRLRETLVREDLDVNERAVLFYCVSDLKGKEEILDYFLNYLPAEENAQLLMYAVQAIGEVKDQRLQDTYVMLLDKYRVHENAKLDYKGSQMFLKGGGCIGASRPEGQLVNSLMHQLDLFGLDKRGAWKLLMNDARWKEWKRQNGFT